MQHKEMTMVTEEENTVVLLKDEVKKGFITEMFLHGSLAH